jgi:hypothetical protein
VNKPLPLLVDVIDCDDCDGSGECFECNGTGHCQACDGDGERETGRAFCNALFWTDAMTQQRCDRRAPDGAGEKWQCDEHQRQAKWLAGRTAS